MIEKTYIKTVWVIAQSEVMAWQLLRKSVDEYVYTDHEKARADLRKVEAKTTFDGWTRGKPWHVFTLTFSVTFTHEGG